MGNLTNITTQSALGDANFLLQEFANNLGAHSNTSLSTSHGIDTFPVLNTDPDNNNRTNFEDALGNTVGTRHLRFIVAGINYWVPGQDTGLAGKPPGTNITDLQGVANTGLGAGDDNWVTTFEQTAVNNISIVNTNYLLPHVKLAHWETHGNITATTEFTYNALGYEVGDTVLKLSIDGTVYKIPAHTRFGGPKQWWSSGRIFTSLAYPSSHNVVIMANTGGNHFASFYYKDQTPIKGTRPRTVTWQINSKSDGSGSSWNNIPPAGGYASTFGSWVGNASLFFFTYSIPPTGLISTPNLLYAIVSVGENWPMSQCVLRARIVAGARTTYTGLCQFLAEDGAPYYIPYPSSIVWPAPAPITLPGVLMHYVGYNQYA